MDLYLSALAKTYITIKNKMRYKSYKCIITFLILLTTCSTYYLHWYNPPYTKKGTVESLQNNRVLEIGPTGLKPVVTIPIAGPAESAVARIDS